MTAPTRTYSRSCYLFLALTFALAVGVMLRGKPYFDGLSLLMMFAAFATLYTCVTRQFPRERAQRAYEARQSLEGAQ